jgi:hypothetical protein
VKTTAAAAQDLLYRTAEIDIDHVKAGLNQLRGPGSELLGLGSHELTPDRPFVIRDAEEVLIPLALVFNRDKELVEHYLADRVRRAMPAGNQAHRPIAVAREGGLDDGEVELQWAESKGRQFRI